MKNKITNQTALIAIFLGIILLVAGGYQVLNPVLAVEYPTGSFDVPPDAPAMLAITTFEVEQNCPTPTIKSLTTPEIRFEGKTAIWRVALDSKNGIAPLDLYGGSAAMAYNGVEWVWIDEKIDWTAPTQTVDLTWNMVATTQFATAFVHLKNSCGAGSNESTPYTDFTMLSDAQIDDTTDIIICNPPVVSPGDNVQMTARGENIGEVNWNGKVTFTVTQPDNIIYTTGQVPRLNVAPGAWQDVNWNFDLPTDAASGTWTLQSRWIDDEGVIHAKASINLGTETIWGVDINVIGGIIALIGGLLLIVGITARKE